ncbi:MAG: hypothetical protein R3Y46_07800 [Opitutales bacterium]
MSKGQKTEKNSLKHLEILRQRSNSSSLPITFLALFLSLIFHLTLYVSMPQSFFEISEKIDRYEDLELEILPPMQELKPLPIYIEANPYANEEKPKDSVTKESFQDQRAKDMIVDINSTSDKPFVDGELPDSQKIISGNNNNNPPNFEAMEITEIMERDLAPPNLKELSSEDFVKKPKEAKPASQLITASTKDFDGDEKAKQAEENSAPTEGETTKIAVEDKGESALKDIFSVEQMDSSGDIKIKENDLKEAKAKETKSENVAQELTQKGDAKEDISTQQKQDEKEKEQVEEVVALPKPKKRPSIDMKITSGILSNNKNRASELGSVAVDSSFSEFGAYQQRMLEAISRQWNLLANEYSLANIANTVVVIEFYLNSKGSLTSFKTLYSNSSHIGITLCEHSIKTTAPYGNWTEDMIAVFGLNDQSVKITFHYR